MVGSDSGANGCPADSALIRQVKQYMRDWFLGRVIRVADPRVLLGEQPPVPAQGACGYIIGGETALRIPHVKAALSRQGRYQQAAGNLQVKEVRIAGAADRFVICYNPDAAVRDAAVREDLIAEPTKRSPGPASCPRRNGLSCAGRSPCCRA
jgi:hypothetical protein